MTVHYVMFAAHADHDQTKRFITELTPPNAILVHGERKAMARVKQSLNRSFGEFCRISDPANCQRVHIEFRKDKVCKVVGALVDEMDHLDTDAQTVNSNYNTSPPRAASAAADVDCAQPNFDGLLVRKDFNYHIMAPRDLGKFTPLTATQIEQSVMIPFAQSFTALSLFVSRIYDIEYVHE